MSLLAGIRFIPKEERMKEEKTKDSKRKDKKEKKKKHEKKEKAKKDYSSGSEIDMKEIEQEELKRGKIEEIIRIAKKYDAVSDEDNSEYEPLERSGTDSTKIENAASQIAEPVQQTNQSVASKLRDRLRQVQGGLEPSLESKTDKESELEMKQKFVALQATFRKGEDANKPDTTIKGLAKMEKFGGEDDIDRIYRDNILRLGTKYKGTEFSTAGAFGNGDRAGLDEEMNVDMKMFEKKALKPQDHEKAFKQQLANAVNEGKRMQQALDHCFQCKGVKGFDHFAGAMIISRGQHAMLCMKIDPFSIAEHHVLIAPIDHMSSILHCDEEVVTEINRFKSCLQHMYAQMNKSVFFLQNAVNFHKRPHAVIDVVPVPRRLEAEAKMFFREAFLTCDEEWSQHKKLLELSNKKPLHRAIPKSFQHLSVEWGIHDPASEHRKRKRADDEDQDAAAADKEVEYGGYAHPVETTALLDRDFCLDVLTGLFDVDPMKMRRKPPLDGAQLHKEMGKIKKFQESWTHCDWTQYLALMPGSNG